MSFERLQDVHLGPCGKEGQDLRDDTAVLGGYRRILLLSLRGMRDVGRSSASDEERGMRV